MINNDGIWRTPYFGDVVDEGYCLYYKIPRNLQKAKSIKIKILSSKNPSSKSFDTEVDAFSIVYRERGNA